MSMELMEVVIPFHYLFLERLVDDKFAILAE
jgi:hypothetical protein